MNNFPALLRKLATWRISVFKGSEAACTPDDTRTPAPLDQANVVSSLIAPATGPVPTTRQHALLIDLDVPAYLVPSSTPGHSHLYVDVAIPEGQYLALLKALADCGVIEAGYYAASRERKATFLRLPWVHKEDQP